MFKLNNENNNGRNDLNLFLLLILTRSTLSSPAIIIDIINFEHAHGQWHKKEGLELLNGFNDIILKLVPCKARQVFQNNKENAIKYLKYMSIH